MSSKYSPRSYKDENRHEILAQVHKTTKSTTSSENDYAVSEDNLEFNSRYEENENLKMHTPSVDISVDGESQINSKILSLIESEIKRDEKRKSHFTDSRPQSLSFYEDEKMPEELSGNLELLSPEEKKHFKKRKEYMQLDDERNLYNSIPDLYNSRDSDEIVTSSNKKHRYRKKRHVDPEMGMGNSMEMMIPKEKQKRRKKRRENSPNVQGSNKRKHRKREDETEPKNEITVALEELQDDVFEVNAVEMFSKPERMKKSPRRTDKLYVQKKNRFEYTGRNVGVIKETRDGEDGFNRKDLSTYHPLEIALLFQSWWMRVSNVCHGLLGGLALGHWLYLMCNLNSQDHTFLVHYAYYSDWFVALFYGLCVVCLISVFDRLDIDNIDGSNIWDMVKRKSTIVVLIYGICLVIHLSTASLDDKISRLSSNETSTNVTMNDVRLWNHLSLWRAIFAFTAWLFLGLVPSDDMLYANLKNMERYFPDK